MERKLLKRAAARGPNIILAGLFLIGAMFAPSVLSAKVVNGTQKALDQAFFFALSRGNINQFASLRDKGADLNVTLKRAGIEAAPTFPDRVAALLETDADIDNWPILTWAVYLENEEVVRILIKSGAALNSADTRGTVPLHWAAWTGHYPITKTLMENGANPFVMDDIGRSPLDWAILTGQADIIRLLPRASMPDPPDDDRDGVPNYRDECPCTPEGVVPDDRGCWVIARNGYFDFNKAAVKKKYIPHIEKAAEVMKKHPHLQLELVGHTDNVGADAYNDKLGLNRAVAVMKVLIKCGVNPKRLGVVSYGESQPIASNDTAFGRAKNRRVEVRVFEPTPSDRVVSKTSMKPLKPRKHKKGKPHPKKMMPAPIAYEAEEDIEIVVTDTESVSFNPIPMMVPGPSAYPAYPPRQMVSASPPPETAPYQPVMMEEVITD